MHIKKTFLHVDGSSDDDSAIVNRRINSDPDAYAEHNFDDCAIDDITHERQPAGLCDSSSEPTLLHEDVAARLQEFDIF